MTVAERLISNFDQRSKLIHKLADMLRRAKAALSALMVLEAGKNRTEADAEALAASCRRLARGLRLRHANTRRRARGHQRVNGDQRRIPVEIRSVVGQQVAQAMHAERSDEVGVMHLPALDGELPHEALRLLRNRARVF